MGPRCRGIDLPAFPDIERVRVNGSLEINVVSVSQGSARPCQYRGNAYRRVGCTTVTMSADEYDRMLFERMYNEQRWEHQGAAGWAIKDLDVAEIRNTVAEAVRVGRLNEPGSREPEELLRGLGRLRDGVLSRAAAVLFGNLGRIECELPQCVLRVARFRCLDRSEFIDNRQFNGNAFALLWHAERFLRDTLSYCEPVRIGPPFSYRRAPLLASRDPRSVGERSAPPGLCVGRGIS